MRQVLTGAERGRRHDMGRPIAPRSGAAAVAGRVDGLLNLQRTAGNRTVCGLLAPAASARRNQVVQRIDISGVDPLERAYLRAAYRTEARAGAMWGRESDLKSMGDGLRVQINVLDFSQDPSSPDTRVIYSYGAGRAVFLKYTGNHYDVLEPASRGLYRLKVGQIDERFRLAFPVNGDGNCMFAAVWYAAYPEASQAFQAANAGAAVPSRLRTDQGQTFLRDYSYRAGGVSEAQIEREIAGMDAANLGDEHIGPQLTTLLAQLGLTPAPAVSTAASTGPSTGTQLTNEQAKEVLSGFDNAPDYWAALKWSMVGDEIYQADLPTDHKLFKDIETSVSKGLKNRKYTSTSQEATRMEAVRGNIKWLEGKEKKGALSSNEKEQLAAAKNRLKEGQKGGPAPPRSREVVIDRVVVTANKRLWNAYQAAATAVRTDLSARKVKSPLSKVKFDGAKEAQLIDNTIAEVRLFHSTSPSTMDLLVKGGFNPAYSANKAKAGAQKARYGPLGQGSYFADVLSKAMTYSQCPVCSDYDCQNHKGEVSQTLLTRVVLGNPKKAHSFVQEALKMKDLRADDLATLKEGRHSVFSEGFAGSRNAFTAGSGLNEFAIKDASLTYPEFRIFYKPK